MEEGKVKNGGRFLGLPFHFVKVNVSSSENMKLVMF